jgi:hypothetical protein
MNMSSFAVELSAEEAQDLGRELREHGNDPGLEFESRAFDGETVVNLLLPVVPAVVVVVRTWLIARAERGKSMSVSIEGQRIVCKGYTARDVIRLFDAIEKKDLRSLDTSMAEPEPTEEEQA